MIRERILQSIYEYKKSKQWHSPYDNPFDIHASEIHDCLRELYFKRTIKLAPNRTLERSLLLYETGNIYHRAIQALFPQVDIEKDVEINFGEFRLIGRPDIVYNGVIYELKAYSYLPAQPYEQTEYQVEVYMRGLKKQSAVIVYIKKSTLEIIEFEVQRNDLRWQDIKTRAKKLVEAYKDKNVPVGEFSPSCRYCVFYSHCKKLKYY